MGARSKHGIFLVGCCTCCAWGALCAQSSWAEVLMGNGFTRALTFPLLGQGFSSLFAFLHITWRCRNEVWWEIVNPGSLPLIHFHRCHLPPSGESLKEVEGLPVCFVTPGYLIVPEETVAVPFLGSRPGWTELVATWSSGRCPCPWSQIGFKVSSNPDHSFYDSFSDSETCFPFLLPLTIF